MTVCIISIDHYFQYVEAETDPQVLRALKERLRGVLEQVLSTSTIGIVFEEPSPNKASIAQELAQKAAIPWLNTCTTTDERIAAGIFDALRNRPGSPDWDDMSFLIEFRIPEDEIREAYFVQRIEGATEPRQKTLVLLGDMHVREFANARSNRGHRVEIVQKLVPKKRSANPGEF